MSSSQLTIQNPIVLGITGQKAVISAYDIAVKNGFVGAESEWLQTLKFIQSPITGEVLAAAQAAAASAFASGASEQVALEKAAEMIQLAQAVLALRNQAESLASASGSFATDSGISATASEAAKVLSESAKVIATQQATISTDKAVESAASAFASEAAKNLSVSAKDTAIVKAGEANQSAIDAATQSGISTTKAGESNQSAIEAFASKQDAESAALSIQSSIQNLGNRTGLVAINLSLGTLVLATLTGGVTLSFTGLPIESRETAFSLRFTNVQSITFPVGTKFAGGQTPSALGPRYELPCTINSSGNIIVYGSINNI